MTDLRDLKDLCRVLGPQGDECLRLILCFSGRRRLSSEYGVPLLESEFPSNPHGTSAACLIASERRGDNLKRVDDICLNAKARI